MSADTVYEVIGYAASALVVISLAMSSIIRLRIVNLAGAVVFAIYGGLIGSIPVVVTNTIIAGLDVWYLRKELGSRQEVSIIPVDASDPFLAAFIDRYRRDIIEFGRLDAEVDVRYVILRNAASAGVFLGRDAGQGTLEVLVDYVAPPFRDLKSGEVLYANEGRRFAELGFDEVRVSEPNPRQTAYFSSMGFVPDHAGALHLSVGV